MLEFIDLFLFLLINAVHVVPATVGAALIAVLGISLSLWRQSVASRRQREFELRREHLLSLAEKAAIPSRMFVQVLNTTIPASETEGLILPALGDLSKSSCVASLATMKAGFEATECFVRLWFDVLKIRIRVDTLQRSIDSIEAQRQNLTTLIEGGMDRARVDVSFANYVRTLIDQRQQLQNQIEGIIRRRMVGMLDLRSKSESSAREYNKFLLEFQIAVRNELDSASRRELGMRIDLDEYRNLSDKSNRLNATASAEFFKWVEAFHAKLLKGEDPFPEKDA